MLEWEWFATPIPGNVDAADTGLIRSPYAFLHYRSRRPRGLSVGAHSGVYDGTFFDLGPRGELVLGDFCTLSAPVVCANTRVVIGDYAFIGWDVVIADSPAPHPYGQMRPGEHEMHEGVESPETTISMGENVWIGTRATVLAGARLGDGAIVGAGAVVDFEVPDYAVVAGNPARIVGHVPPAG